MPDVAAPAVPAPLVDRPWRCLCEASLGHVQRVQGIRRLFVYRAAVDETDCGDVVAVLTGMGRIRCSRCGQVRQWEPGAEAMAEMLARRRR